MQTTLSHYRMLEQIGAGSMGVVYRAHDDNLDRDVALKVLPEGTLAEEAAHRRFKKEALAFLSPSHDIARRQQAAPREANANRQGNRASPGRRGRRKRFSCLCRTSRGL